MNVTNSSRNRLALVANALATLLICGAFATVLHAHNGLHDHDNVEMESRCWKMDSGNSEFKGSFVSASEDEVVIHLRSGRVATFQIESLSASDQKWLQEKREAIIDLNQSVSFVSMRSPVNSSPNFTKKAEATAKSVSGANIAQYFQHFVDSKAIKTRTTENFLFVESNGLPDHQMMVGITAWQQQVPIPHDYTGENAWRIPLKPVPAARPMSAKTNFFRGAIALAVNGVSIFNPIKNDGRTDTKLAGELDEFGGHCGRADDYHYHLPPVHLEKVVGAGKPIAFALDGYPIFGFQSKEEAAKSKLDALNGHKDEKGNYHYHSTKAYPYLNGGFYGSVVERGGQVDPQPRANGIRPAERPLRGATITGFARSKDGKSVKLEYKVRNETRTVSYKTKDFKTYAFTYNNGSQGKTTETYSVRPARRGGPDGQGKRRGGQKKRQPDRKRDNQQRGG